MTEITGTGDPARSLSLLWRLVEPAPRGRGAEAGLSVDRVVDAAIALADAEGLARALDATPRHRPRRRRDDAVHLRPGQGRAARPHGRQRARRVPVAVRPGGRPLARPARGRRARQLVPLRAAPVAAARRRVRPAAAGPRRPHQVRARAPGGRRHGSRRGRDGRRVHPRSRGSSPGPRGGGRPGRRRAGHRDHRDRVVGGDRARSSTRCTTRSASRRSPASGRSPARRSRRPTTPAGRSSSVSPVCSTGSRCWSTPRRRRTRRSGRAARKVRVALVSAHAHPRTDPVRHAHRCARPADPRSQSAAGSTGRWRSSPGSSAPSSAACWPAS